MHIDQTTILSRHEAQRRVVARKHPGLVSQALLLAAYAHDERVGMLEVGAAGDCGGGTPWRQSDCTAGTGRPWTAAPSEPCVVKPPRCDCHVIGSNTLGTTGIAVTSQAARFGDVRLDSGDASAFVPYYMFITAYQAGGAAPTTTIQGTALPVLLCNSRSGRNPNMRRASDDDPRFGVMALAYSETKELECVDWQKFASVNNQQIVLRFYNPNNVTVHVFVDMWGIPLS